MTEWLREAQASHPEGEAFRIAGDLGGGGT
jgi:hypothetical protein